MWVGLEDQKMLFKRVYVALWRCKHTHNRAVIDISNNEWDSILVKIGEIRPMSSMIHSARPTVSLVATIVLCCFVLLDLKSGDGRTNGRTTCAKIMITTGRDCGSAEWIKSYILKRLWKRRKVQKRMRTGVFSKSLFSSFPSLGKTFKSGTEAANATRGVSKEGGHVPRAPNLWGADFEKFFCQNCAPYNLK